jgi:hypothetical protein
MEPTETIVGDGRWGLRRFDRRRFLQASLLGVDTQHRLRTRDNRPVDLTDQGRVIEGL